MRQLLGQVARSPVVWVIVGGISIAVVGLVMAAVFAIQSDYRRQLNASEHRAVEAITKTIADLRAKDTAAEVERQRIRREVEVVKKTAEQLKAEVQGQAP
jgi:nitric oxide reductase activation protein